MMDNDPFPAKKRALAKSHPSASSQAKSVSQSPPTAVPFTPRLSSSTNKICLVWVHQCSPLYQRLFRQVLRVICSYLCEWPLALISDHDIRFFNLVTNLWEDAETLDARICCDSRSRYVAVEGGKVVVTGNYGYCGDDALGNESYLLHLGTNCVHVETLPSMTQRRTYHAILYFAGFVYVFAGYITSEVAAKHQCIAKPADDGERIDIQQKSEWVALPGEMMSVRMDFSATEHNHLVYFCGGVMTCTIELFSLDTQTFLGYIGPQLPELTPALSFVYHGEIFIISANFACRMTLGERPVLTARKNTGRSYCALSGPPVVVGKFVYAVNAPLRQCYAVAMPDMEQEEVFNSN